MPNAAAADAPTRYRIGCTLLCSRSALAAFNADILQCVRCDLRTDAFTILSIVGSRVVISDSTVEGGSFAIDAWCGDASADVTGAASCGQCATPAPAAAASVARRGRVPTGATRPEIPAFEPW